ncbi:MAG TPA: phage baseplate assembly protein V [Candidatus Acidoferrum sp.]|nr:phage baseplate assembly protein V [Candidatus Acidoferrum sp.]
MKRFFLGVLFAGALCSLHAESALADPVPVAGVLFKTTASGLNSIVLNTEGIFFAPESDDEVLVSFEEGDPRSPVIVGSLWDGSDAPPETDIADVPTDVTVLGITISGTLKTTILGSDGLPEIVTTSFSIHITPPDGETSLAPCAPGAECTPYTVTADVVTTPAPEPGGALLLAMGIAIACIARRPAGAGAREPA